MDLYYHATRHGNFGDDLNLWLWDSLLPGWRDWDPQRVLVGVGTLLSSTLIDRERGAERRYLVAGTGVGYGSGRLPDVSDASRWDIRSLRGPRSARSLGLDEALGIVDPAVMLPTLPEFRDTERSGRPIFIPHESTVERHDWASACGEVELDFVSPRGEAKQVIRRIAAAPLVLAESMHAAIIADAFRTPWVPVRIGHKFLLSKWLDWSDSLEIPLNQVPPMFPTLDAAFGRIRRATSPWRDRKRRQTNQANRPRSGGAQGPGGDGGRMLRLQTNLERRRVVPALKRSLEGPRFLSRDARLQDRQERYLEVLEGIRRDYG